MELGRRDRALTRVLVVERQAHERVGHSPVLASELARGFVMLGCQVTMLTARGWCLETEDETGFSVSRYGPLAAALDGFGERLRSNQWRHGRGWLRRMGAALQVIVMTRAAAAKRRRLGRETVVVVVSYVDASALIGAFAGDGAWLVYVYWA